jgi:hypothetical protein
LPGLTDVLKEKEKRKLSRKVSLGKKKGIGFGVQILMGLISMMTKFQLN